MVLKHVPDHLKTQEMCEKAVKDELDNLEFVPDCFKTKTMCERAVEKFPGALENVPITSLPKKCVKGSLKGRHFCLYMSLTVLRRRGCLKKWSKMIRAT